MKQNLDGAAKSMYQNNSYRSLGGDVPKVLTMQGSVDNLSDFSNRDMRKSVISEEPQTEIE